MVMVVISVGLDGQYGDGDDEEDNGDSDIDDENDDDSYYWMMIRMVRQVMMN